MPKYIHPDAFAACDRARKQYIRLYDATNAKLIRLTALHGDMRERCATIASALEITIRILSESRDPQLHAAAEMARQLLTTAGTVHIGRGTYQ